MPDSEDDDEVVIICQPATVEWHSVIAGSTLGKCRDCGCQVWLAPSGQKIRLERGAVLVCIDCGGAKLQGEDAPKLEDLTPEQIAEIRDHFRRERLQRPNRRFELEN